MADMGWTARMATAAGAAAGTGAAQLGLGYGLGVVVWPVVATPDDSAWLGSLGWATWITASATVFGAVIASRLGGPRAERPRGPWRLGLAISAGVGALVAVALIALPARDAVRVDTSSPQLIAAGYALVGLGLGVLVAYWAVVSRPVAANLIATAVWLWALAITAIVIELTLHRSSATYLTSWQFAEATAGGRYGTIYWPSALLTVAAAFLIGILAAAPAARRGERGLGTATSGAVGPLLVAASFVVLAPRLTGALGPLGSAYLIAPYAVLAGLGGSAVTVAITQAVANRRARKAAARGFEADDDETYDDESDDDESDTAAFPAAGPKAKAPTPTGRAKLPTQPKPATEPAARDSATSAEPTGARPAAPAGAPGPAGSASAPSPRPAGTASSGTGGRSGTTRPSDPTTGSDRQTDPGPPARPAPAPAPSPGTAIRPPGTPPAGTADRPPGTPPASAADRPPGTPPASAASNPVALRPSTSAPTAPRPVNPANPPRTPEVSAGPKPGSFADPFADPEVAEAARPARGRAKKVAPARKTPPPKETKSTVTPPPSSPTIAQINPKPPPSD